MALKLKLAHALTNANVIMVSGSLGTHSHPQFHLLIQQITLSIPQPHHIQVYIRQKIT